MMQNEELIDLAGMDAAELQAAAKARAAERKAAERRRQEQLDADFATRLLFGEAYGSGDEFLVAVMRGTHFGVEIGEVQQCRRGGLPLRAAHWRLFAGGHRTAARGWAEYHRAGASRQDRGLKCEGADFVGPPLRAFTFSVRGGAPIQCWRLWGVGSGRGSLARPCRHAPGPVRGVGYL